MIGTAPWHATVYRFVKNVSNYEFLCGGSIISSNLIVTGKIFAKRICKKN